MNTTVIVVAVMIIPFSTANLSVVPKKANTCLQKIKILINPSAEFQTEKLIGQLGNPIWTHALLDGHFFMGLDFSLCEFRLPGACVSLFILQPYAFFLNHSLQQLQSGDKGLMCPSFCAIIQKLPDPLPAEHLAEMLPFLIRCSNMEEHRMWCC